MWWKMDRIEITFQKRKGQKSPPLTQVLRILQQDKYSFVAHQNYKGGNSVFAFQEDMNLAILTRQYLLAKEEKQVTAFWKANCKFLLSEIYE